MEIEREVGCGEALCIEPTIGAQRKVANAWLAGKLPAVFEPMIEPTQQQRIGIEQSVGTEVVLADHFPPRDVNPGTGDQILIPVNRHGSKAIDAASQVGIEPAGEVECGEDRKSVV